MHKIIKEIKSIIYENLEKYLPEIKMEQLEENGAIYYMNGKNGTEFDWYVNEKLSDFMIFYNDEDNMGAVKFTLYTDGSIYIYFYGEQGKKLVKEIGIESDFEEYEILKLAVVLRNQADDKLIWDANIENINCDIDVSDEVIDEFEKNREFYMSSINRRKLLSKVSYVSRKILDEGYKVGYMVREEALNEQDSGWSFLAGNEEDEYMNDAANIALLSVGEVSYIDMDILSHIDAPVGTAFIRVSSSEFEVDDNTKEIYIKR